MNIPIAKQKTFIKEFEKIRPVYVEFARLLEKILLNAINQLGYLAIVQVRVKKVVSFSNKIIMKDKYKNPLTDVTDLCGGRVIVHFQSQVAAVCDFIKKNFTIDEANSLDLRSKLKVNEFGYRSVHYIITPNKSSIMGIPIKKKFRTLKAEIQVRTLAEHIWADISHDRIYKTELIIPEEWKREAARLSAILENADITFGSMAQAIDSVSNTYELQSETGKAKINVEKLETLVAIQTDEPEEGAKNVLNLILVYKTLNQSEKAITLLHDWIKIMRNNIQWEARLKFELSMLELTSCSGDIDKPENENKINSALDCLQILDRLYKKNHIPSASSLSFLYYRLGCLLQNSQLKAKEAIEALSRALELMPDNPLCLTALTESMVMENIAMSHQTITLFRNTFEKNITDLERLISLGIDAIPAWFATGRCHFFLGNSRECIKAYSNAVAVIIDNNLTSDCYIINEEIIRAKRLKRFDEKLAGQIVLYLNIAMAISDISEDKKAFLNTLRTTQLRKEEMKKPVVIVAGGASLMDKTKVESYREYIKELMHDFNGTIISGGTKAGIPGLVGRLKEEMNKVKPVYFDLVAYLPGKLPRDAKLSGAYDHLYRTKSDEFSALDILASWTDIILSEIPPSEVIIIGINGGEIADLEYRIALSLGAKVCLIAFSGRAVMDLAQEKPWKDHPNLIIVPNDPLTVWAIVNQKKPSSLTSEEIEKLAPLVHEFYRNQRLKSFKTGETDVNKFKVIMRWEKLDPVLQESNRLQVAFYEHILKRVNLEMHKAKKKPVVLYNIKKNLSKQEHDMLAKLEHARWNAERMFEGWRYGPVKDLVKKINPYLVAWEKLDEAIKPYDYDPVDNIPLMLEKIGYEVFRIRKRTGKAPVRRSVK